MEADKRLAYLAGFFDGEGSITVKMNPNGKSMYYSLLVRVHNTDFEVIDFIHYYYNGILDGQERSGDLRTGYQVQWYGKDAADILRAMYPYLINKKSIAGVAIEFWDKCFADRGKNTVVSEAENILRDHYRVTIDSMQIKPRRSAKYAQSLYSTT